MLDLSVSLQIFQHTVHPKEEHISSIGILAKPSRRTPPVIVNHTFHPKCEVLSVTSGAENILPTSLISPA